jgi:hypothetical protein
MALFFPANSCADWRYVTAFLMSPSETVIIVCNAPSFRKTCSTSDHEVGLNEEDRGRDTHTEKQRQAGKQTEIEKHRERKT